MKKMIITLIILIILIAIVMNLQKTPVEEEVTQDTVSDTQETVTEQIPTEQEILPPQTETPPEETAVEEPEQQEADEGVLTGLACVGDNVEGIINNPTSSQVSVSDVRVVFNGQVVNSVTMRCDQSVILPGGSTKCLSLQGILPITGENEVGVAIGSESDTGTITC